MCYATKRDGPKLEGIIMKAMCKAARDKRKQDLINLEYNTMDIDVTAF